MTDNPVNKNEQPEKPECDHIVGHDDGYYQSPIYESTDLLCKEEDFVYKYCPLCGVKLEGGE